MYNVYWSRSNSVLGNHTGLPWFFDTKSLQSLNTAHVNNKKKIKKNMRNLLFTDSMRTPILLLDYNGVRVKPRKLSLYLYQTTRNYKLWPSLGRDRLLSIAYSWKLETETWKLKVCQLIGNHWFRNQQRDGLNWYTPTATDTASS